MTETWMVGCAMALGCGCREGDGGWEDVPRKRTAACSLAVRFGHPFGLQSQPR